MENIGHLEEILCVLYQRIWKIIFEREIFTTLKESVFSPRFNKGMDMSPVCSHCSERTGFAIFSVFRTVKLLLMNLASLYAGVPQTLFYFPWHYFFISLDGVVSADSACSKYWIAVFLHINLVKEKKYHTMCISIKIWLYTGF